LRKEQKYLVHEEAKYGQGIGEAKGHDKELI